MVYEANGRQSKKWTTFVHERIENGDFSPPFNMVESDHDIALEDTDRIHGRSALVNNVRAASSLAGAIRSTLGPKGLDKMLVEEDGSALVTNDGVTVIETANVEHPTARMLIDASSSQDRAARDGTTTTILLVAEMLQNALELVRMGVHPSVIVNGFEIALKESLLEIARLSIDANNVQKKRVVMTSLHGKGDSSLCEKISSLAILAAENLSEEKGEVDLERFRIKRIQVGVGNVMETDLVNGLMLLKSRVDVSSSKDSGSGNVAIIDGGLERAKLEINASIEVESPEALKEFHKRSIKRIEEKIEHLSSIGVDLLVVREGIEDEVISLLTKLGIVAYRRFERKDLELLSKITGAKPVRDPSRITEADLGRFSGRSEERIADVKHTLIEGEGVGMTLVVKGSSPAIREETIRIFDDAIGVAHRLNSSPGILPGGGATQSHLARHLRSFSQTQSGREQLAIEAYASALESIPMILAENAGMDPVDAILSLSADQKSSGSWMGLDLEKGKNRSMMENGVLDPEFVVRHALSGATEAAISVLRIDDVLWARTDPSTPDWQEDIEDYSSDSP